MSKVKYAVAKVWLDGAGYDSAGRRHDVPKGPDAGPTTLWHVTLETGEEHFVWCYTRVDAEEYGKKCAKREQTARRQVAA